MHTPARFLRVAADNMPNGRPRFTTRELEQQDRILAVGTVLLARYGRAGLTMGTFAGALRMAPITIRKHYPDLDTLLATILMNHLHAIACAMGGSRDAADPKAARRAAYVRHTRPHFNGHSDGHALLLRDRHALPPDLAEPIEELRLQIGEMLHPDHPEIALALLDEPSLQPAQIEAMLATLPARQAALPVTPEPPPAEAPAQPAAAEPAKVTHPTTAAFVASAGVSFIPPQAFAAIRPRAGPN